MKNLQFTFRMFERNPLLVFVNIPGLAIGLSAVLLLSVYLNHELSFDKHFSTKDHVFRLYNTITENNTTQIEAICLRKSYTEIPQLVPEIKSATQLYHGWTSSISVEDQNIRYADNQLLYADKDFFEVFGLSLMHGNAEEALVGEKKAVLTKTTALKIYKRTDCVGEIISISDEPFMITGVIEDLPNTTHFNFDILASMETVHPENWGGLELYTYFLIHDHADMNAAAEKIIAANNEIMQPWAAPFDAKVESGVERLSSIHLHTPVNYDLSPKANIAHIQIIALIAFFILLIAIFNFINLYILHGEKRISEIAARKSLGANKAALAKLFFTETGIIGFIALAMAVVLSLIAQPYFAQLMQSKVSYSEILSPSGLLIASSILVVLVLAAGSYPSYYLSNLDLVSALKGKSIKVKRKSTLSRLAVILQFSISVFLITAFTIVYAQTNYLKNMPIGFNPDHVIGITNLDNQIVKSKSSIENELLNLSFVESVGSSTHGMGQGYSVQGIKTHGTSGSILSINEYRINPGFDKTMQLELIEGRYFSQSKADTSGVLLNEAAVKMLGGNIKTGSLVDMHGNPLHVIGIVKNFIYDDNPGEAIAPLVMTNYWYNVRNIYIRTLGNISIEQQSQIEQAFKNHSPDFIYGQFELKEVYNNKFSNEERVIKLVSSGATMAVIISFIGLLALSILNVNRRKKEIGIRKVMGSSEAKVVRTLLSETFILVSIAIAIAIIASFFSMHRWLENFVDRINLSPYYFLLSSAFALLIAFMAVGWQSWRAARRNPVEALRYE